MACQPKVWQIIWFAFEPKEHMPLFCSIETNPTWFHMLAHHTASTSVCSEFEVGIWVLLITTQYLLARLTILTDSHQFSPCS